MNAPEIRRGDALADPQYNIERSWIDQDHQTIDVDSMQDYLNTLPHNELLRKGLEYLRSTNINSLSKRRLEIALNCCLQDHPRERTTMFHLTKIFSEQLGTQEWVRGT